MRKSFRWPFILLFFTCSCGPETFDAMIARELSASELEYSVSEMTDSVFQKMRKTIEQNRLLVEPGARSIDPYGLVGFINRAHPDFDTFLAKYNAMDPSWRVTFFEVLVVSGHDFYTQHQPAFRKLLADAQPPRYGLFAKKILTQYMSATTARITTMRPVIETDSLNHANRNLLALLVHTEKENNFGLDLLTYLRTRTDWPSTDNYINYWHLSETKNADLNKKYKDFFRKELLREGYDDTPWNGYSGFLPRWFTRDEIMDICREKLKETKVYKQYYYQAERLMTSQDLYVSNAGYYQAAYFPIQSTIRLIEDTKISQVKLNLIFALANNRFELTKEQRKKMMTIVLSFAGDIRGSSESEKAVLTVKSLNPEADYSFIAANFPNLYSQWNPPDFLQQKFNAARYNWKDFITISNKLNTFDKPLSEPGEYLKCEYMHANSAYRLSDITTMRAVLQSNKWFILLDDEVGDWPVEYGYIVNSALKELPLDAFSPSLLHEFTYGKQEGEAIYKLHLKFGNKLHSIGFNHIGSYPNNKALWLLLNKALIDSGSKDRLIRDNDDYGLVLAQPERYRVLMKRLK